MILFSFCLDLLIAVLGAAGVAMSFRANGWGMFQYYTLLSNLFLLLACAAQAWYEANIALRRRLYVPSWVRVAKYFAVCTTTVTFFVVLFILVPMAGGLSMLAPYLTQGSMLYHHLLCPVLGFVSFVFLDRANLPDRRVTLWALAPTALYATVTIVLNAIGKLYGPYPFMLVREQPFYMSVFWCALILALAWALAYLVWRLSLRFGEPRAVEEDGLPEAAGWTEDGYLKNQEALYAYTYRTIPAGDNACGPVAAYNLRHHEGHDARLTDVLAEMDDLHLLCVPGPTLMYVMRKYLRKYLPNWRETRGKDACLAAAARSRMGVFRYHEQKIPHFVAYYRAGGDLFRFLNIWDDIEDVQLTMEKFGRDHLLGGSVRLIYWE